MTVAIRPVRFREKDELRALFERYLIEQADLVDPARLNGDPTVYPYFDLYWTEQDRLPLWIVAERERAGFVLLNSWSPSGRGVDCAIAEFWIAPDRRGHGIGLAAALAAFRLKSGWWELQVYRANEPAMAFWPKALGRAPAMDREVLDLDDRVVHRLKIT